MDDTILLSLQKKSLLKMLNLNQELKDDAPVLWKVLIYDKFCQDVISPSLLLGDLRNSGVTLHLPLKSQRQPVPDVPVVYFVQPTIENINVIAEDLKRNLYDSISINFSSTLPRGLLEELAGQTVQSGSSSNISQVYDQFLNFICLESNLFSLDIHSAYQTFHNPISPESLIEKTVEDISIALFSVVVTYGLVPIIKCPAGNVAEAVAKKLDSRLRDNILNSRTNLFAEKMLLPRPVLVILDRDLDLSSLLGHSWTYSTLFHDLLEMKLNRVSLTVEEKGRPVAKTYDIDVSESFWQKNAASPLPEVGMFIDKETKSYKEEVHNVGAAPVDDTGDAALSTQALSSTIKALPELRRRQKVLDMHTVIATSLLNSIVNRQLDSFIKMEETLSDLTVPALLEVIRDPKKDAQDKLRLTLMFFLNSTLSKSDMDSAEQALKDAGCQLEALQYVKKIQMVSKMTSTQSQSQQATVSSTNDLLGSFTSNFSKLTEGLQSVGIGEGFGNILAGVRNMLPKRQELPFTRIVDAIMEGTNSQGTGVESYLTFDPKSPKSTHTSTPIQAKRTTFTDAIVFVIGGGNYQEYHNLMEYAQRSSNVTKKSIIYGSTDLVSSSAFIREMETIG